MIKDLEPAADEQTASEPAAESGAAADSSGDGLDDLVSMVNNIDGEEAVSNSSELFEEDASDLTGMLPPEGEEAKKEAKEKKPGFFKRIFGNVVNEEIAEAERQAKVKEEEEAAAKAEEEAKAKEEKEAKKAAAAEAKAAKKAEKAAAKAEKAEAKAAKKAEKAAKKAEEEAAAEQEVVGRLNKVGVTIVVVFAVFILAAVIGGTNLFGYKVDKSEAERYFALQKYSEAYEKIMGTKAKKKDKETYEKITLVMKVQQSLDSYSSYARLKHYPDALNALLRGLQKYDENYDAAMDLEIEGDLNVCKDRILGILKDEFGLTEADARSILNLDDKAYSDKVVSIAMKKS